MAVSADPWALLGISRQAGERDVKKAYARLLKIVRPDQDIEAFQNLVGARDTALAFARRAATPASPATRDHEAREWLPTSVDAPAGVDLRPPTPPVIDMSSKAAPVVEANPRVQADDLSPKVAPAVALPVVGLTPTTPPISEPALETTAPPAGESAKSGPESVPSLPDLVEPEIDEKDLPKLLDTIVAGLDPQADEVVIETTNKAIGKLTGLPFAAHKFAEARLLRAMAPLVPVISTRLMTGRPRGLNWLTAMIHGEDAERRRAALQLTFVHRLNEEFGWTQEDRRVYELVGRDIGAALVPYLNAFGRALRLKKAAAEGRNAPRIPPMLEERDVQTFFGDTRPTHARLLAQVRSGDRLRARWQTIVFLTLPVWLLRNADFRSLTVWLVTAAVALAAVSAADTHQAATISFGGHDIHYWPLVVMVSYLPLLAVHLWAAAYAYRWDVRRFLNRVAAADRRGIFDPGQRAAFVLRAPNRSLQRVSAVIFALATLVVGLAVFHGVFETATGAFPAFADTLKTIEGLIILLVYFMSRFRSKKSARN
jgi:hypothetical protein